MLGRHRMPFCFRVVIESGMNDRICFFAFVNLQSYSDIDEKKFSLMNKDQDANWIFLKAFFVLNVWLLRDVLNGHVTLRDRSGDSFIRLLL